MLGRQTARAASSRHQKSPRDVAARLAKLAVAVEEAQTRDAVARPQSQQVNVARKRVAELELVVAASSVGT